SIIASYHAGAGLIDAIEDAKKAEIPESYIMRLLAMLNEGEPVSKTEHVLNWDSGVYSSVFGQNSNNSVRVSDEFIKAVLNDEEYSLRWRIDNKPCKTLKARYLWNEIAKAAWAC